MAALRPQPWRQLARFGLVVVRLVWLGAGRCAAIVVLLVPPSPDADVVLLHRRDGGDAVTATTVMNGCTTPSSTPTRAPSCSASAATEQGELTPVIGLQAEELGCVLGDVLCCDDWLELVKH